MKKTVKKSKIVINKKQCVLRRFYLRYACSTYYPQCVTDFTSHQRFFAWPNIYLYRLMSFNNIYLFRTNTFLVVLSCIITFAGYHLSCLLVALLIRAIYINCYLNSWHEKTIVFFCVLNESRVSDSQEQEHRILREILNLFTNNMV